MSSPSSSFPPSKYGKVLVNVSVRESGHCRYGSRSLQCDQAKERGRPDPWKRFIYFFSAHLMLLYVWIFPRLGVAVCDDSIQLMKSLSFGFGFTFGPSSPLFPYQLLLKSVRFLFYCFWFHCLLLLVFPLNFLHNFSWFLPSYLLKFI